MPRPHPTLVTRRVLVMERLSGFNFDDVAGMQDAGIDTEAVIRTGMIAFMEGAIVHGIFHGDLHGGNLFVLPDGRTALLDFGIVARLSEERRLAFLRLMLGATTNDVHGADGCPARPRRAPPRHRSRGGRPRPRPRSPADRPDHAHRRRDGERGPARGQGTARLRRQAAEGTDALRQEHGVPRRGDRPAGARSRHPRRDRDDLDAVRPTPRRAPRVASSASSPVRSSSTSRASRPDSVSMPRSTA